MQIIPVRNRLAYPAGVAPGFDPNHVAKACVFSAFATASGFHSIKKSGAGVVNGSPTFGLMQSGIGSCVDFTGATDAITFSGVPNFAANQPQTAAAIVVFNAGSSFSYIFSAGNTSSGGPLLGRSGTTLFFGGTNSVTLGSPVVGTPYFVAASNDGAAVTNFLMLNLATGQLTTLVAGYTATTTTVGNVYNVGNRGDFGTRQGLAKPAAVACFAAYHSMSTLIKWADDPWSFWYPDPILEGQSQSRTPAAPFVPSYTASPRQAVYAGPPPMMVGGGRIDGMLLWTSDRFLWGSNLLDWN